MNNQKREFGVIGLGRMGGGLALQAREKGMKVVGNTRGGLPAELRQGGVIEARRLEDFKQQLDAPRAIFLYIPASPTMDKLLDELAAQLDPADVIVDGGNSYWGDAIRRHERLKQSFIELVDLGTSGGVDGARHGACFMAGGERKAIERIEPMLIELAVEGGYVHAGPARSGALRQARPQRH